MKKKLLRAACIARDLESHGGKRILVDRLTTSLTAQMKNELKQRKLADQREEERKNSLGGVWTFGSNFAGQLGHGDTDPRSLPTQIRRLRGFGIKSVFAGFDSNVAFALTKKGDVFVWGNRSGPTGLNTSVSLGGLYQQTLDLAAEHEIGIDHSETRVKSLDEESDSDIDDEEEIDTGEGILHPVLVHSLRGEEVDVIQVGRVHAIARTTGGDVFTWGHNDHSQLGNEPAHSLSQVQSKKAKTNYGMDVSVPQIWNRTISSTEIALDVVAGIEHSIVITSDNQIKSFGSTFQTENHSSIARALAKYQVVQASCGANHAAILTTGGQVFTFGSGDGGKLGHGDNTSHVTPRLVQALANDVVIQVACGCWHTLALVLVPPLIKGGFVYSWGSGRVGQLGQGAVQYSPLPTLIRDLLVTHVVVKKMYAGMFHNAVLSAEDQVYTWGSNVNGCLGRPEELDENPEPFCVVPGRIEGLQDFVGRVCSVACGKEFTLVATKPYTGLNRQELELREEEEAERLIAIARGRAAEEKKLEKLQKQMESQIAEFMVTQLNQQHPLCTICLAEEVCPGYQDLENKPSTCRHCLHSRRKHSRLRQIQGETYGYDHCLTLVDTLDIEIDVTEIEAKYPELIQEEGEEEEEN